MNSKAKREQKLGISHFLHMDNARAHLGQSKCDLMGIHRLPHPPESPDIALCDFWFFGSFKMKLEEMVFDTPAALFPEVEETFGDIRITEWVTVFDESKGCLK
jgi:hypothetical protein